MPRINFHPYLRKSLAFSLLAAVAICVSWIFWKTEIKYSLPTPVPQHFKEVAAGTRIALPDDLAQTEKRPLLIHFFNPDCPCSRFNIRQFRSLVSRYGDSIDFAIVALTEKAYTADAIRDKFGLDLAVYFDSGLAQRCGVISTPQAVLLDSDSRLFFKGNYNKSRYCTDAKSDYARMAIDSLLRNTAQPVFNKQAHIAYGCALPSSKTCTPDAL